MSGPKPSVWLARALCVFSVIGLGSTFAWLGWQIPSLDTNGPRTLSIGPATEIGLNLVFRLDGVSLLFGIIASAIGALTALYSHAYLADHPRRSAFQALMLAFGASMLGLVLADDLILHFVCFELTTLFSFLLIGFEADQPAARTAAVKAAVVTGSGGIVWLFTILLLISLTGSTRFSDLLKQRTLIEQSGLSLLVLGGLCVAVFTKSAQFPFHSWLPAAMVAPTPVSAYLHSAAMVQAGIYLLLRFQPLLGGTSWEIVMISVGGVTMLLSALLALTQSDLKAILAYSTRAALGLLVTLLGIGTPLALEAAALYVLVHALYKSGLFLVAGAVEHATGTRDVEQLSGLGKTQRVLALAAFLAAGSMAGLPPLVGWIAKERVYHATEQLKPLAAWGLSGAALFVNVALFAAAGSVSLKTFTGKPSKAVDAARPLPVFMSVPMLALAITSLWLGVFSSSIEAMLRGVAQSLLKPSHEVRLALWSGFGWPWVLSSLTLAAGVAVYRASGTIRQASARQWGSLRPVELLLQTFSGALQRGQAGLRWGVVRLERAGLRFHVRVALSAVGLGLVLTSFESWGALSLPGLRLTLEGLVLAAASLAGLGMVIARGRFAAVLALTMAGYAIAVFFSLRGAPELSITQLVVETVVLLLFVAVLSRIPRASFREHRVSVLGDVCVCALLGGAMGVLTQLLQTHAAEPFISDRISERAEQAGTWKNLVNFILSEVRALDTLGEILVLGTAALGVRILIKRNTRALPSTAHSSQGLNGSQLAPKARACQEEMPSLILNTVTRGLTPLLLLFGCFLLLRGHDEPGGGFIGGFVVAAAVLLDLLSRGAPHARRSVKIEPERLIGLGLLLALGSALIGPILGEPPLSAERFERDPRWFGHIVLGVPLVFELGVVAVSMGAVLTIILRLTDVRAEPTEEP